MEISIEGSFSTPSMNYNSSKKELRIEGRIIPEDPDLCFKPLQNWVDVFENSSQAEVVITLLLFYYNTSSKKRLVEIFKRLDELNSGSKSVTINWECEEDDEDCLDDGKDFQRILDLPFNIIEVEEQD
ncbi:MAG: SiaC family regulatory phosphoprotein [Flavobacteriales bacterium]|nr:SiaC family regulatory phosphoprotein [Flavobacteriales bacterium]